MWLARAASRSSLHLPRGVFKQSYMVKLSGHSVVSQSGEQVITSPPTGRVQPMLSDQAIWSSYQVTVWLARAASRSSLHLPRGVFNQCYLGKLSGHSVVSPSGELVITSPLKGRVQPMLSDQAIWSSYQVTVWLARAASRSSLHLPRGVFNQCYLGKLSGHSVVSQSGEQVITSPPTGRVQPMLSDQAIWSSYLVTVWLARAASRSSLHLPRGVFNQCYLVKLSGHSVVSQSGEKVITSPPTRRVQPMLSGQAIWSQCG